MLNIPQDNRIKIVNILYAFLLVIALLFCNPVEAPGRPSESFKLRSQDYIAKQRDCLLEALYKEAGGESFEGKKAVLSVIHNRVLSDGFPSTYCKVVQAPKAFSYRNHLKVGEKVKIRIKNSIDKKSFQEVEFLANEAVLGHFKPSLPKSVLWYTQVQVSQSWMKNLKVQKVIGKHKFLKEA